jgi:signal peptidase I
MNRKNSYIAILLTAIMPCVGMLNIGRGTKSIIYFFLSVFSIFFSLTLIHFRFFENNTVLEIIFLFQCIINEIASLHCYFLLKRNIPRSQEKYYSKWYIILLIIFTSLLLFVLLNQFILTRYRVAGDGMQPSLHSGQVVLSVNPSVYHSIQLLNNILFNFKKTNTLHNKGQMVVYYVDVTPLYRWHGIARIVGKTGDSFKAIDHKLYANNKHLIGNGVKYKIVPDDHYLLRLDSPPSLVASDTLVHKKQIVGYIKYIAWDHKTRKFVGKFLI